MKTAQLLNYTRDHWIPGDGASLSPIASALDGSLVASTGSGGIDFGAMLGHLRKVGGLGWPTLQPSETLLDAGDERAAKRLIGIRRNVRFGWKADVSQGRWWCLGS